MITSMVDNNYVILTFYHCFFLFDSSLSRYLGHFAVIPNFSSLQRIFSTVLQVITPEIHGAQ